MAQREKLIELIVKCDKENEVLDCFESRPKKAQAAEIIADHLLHNGVIVPPCKVGDTVYTNTNGTTLHNSFKINSMDLLGFSNGLYSWTWHQLGKSVFLSIEEAKKALKEREK